MDQKLLIDLDSLELARPAIHREFFTYSHPQQYHLAMGQLLRIVKYKPVNINGTNLVTSRKLNSQKEYTELLNTLKQFNVNYWEVV